MSCGRLWCGAMILANHNAIKMLIAYSTATPHLSFKTTTKRTHRGSHFSILSTYYALFFFVGTIPKSTKATTLPTMVSSHCKFCTRSCGSNCKHISIFVYTENAVMDHTVRIASHACSINGATFGSCGIFHFPGTHNRRHVPRSSIQYTLHNGHVYPQRQINYGSCSERYKEYCLDTAESTRRLRDDRPH